MIGKTFILPLALAFPSGSNAADFIAVKERPVIESPAVIEASGLAVSTENPNFMWAINDSGCTSDIHLIGIDGADHGKLAVTNAKNIDWEDLASFRFEGKNYLLIADTGDNDAVRKSCTLHILREPELPASGVKLSMTAATAWHINFTYEGGPRDCESAAVDAVSGKIILVSKRTTPPEIYELPLQAPEKRGAVVAKRIGQLSVDSPTRTLIPYANQPTGFDISEDRSLAAIVTYYGVFLFPRQPAETWADALSRKPISLGPHGIGQVESIAISKDSKSVFVTPEGERPPIICYQRR
jgi:hypothetical protein